MVTELASSKLWEKSPGVERDENMSGKRMTLMVSHIGSSGNYPVNLEELTQGGGRM